MTKNDRYQRALDEMYGLRRFGIKLGLDVIRSMLGNLGDPQNAFSCVHVAGSNGKGSIASALAAILTASGFKTGLYTSPHLVKFNERMLVDGSPISDDTVVRAWEAAKAAHDADRSATFFEYATAMALYAFAEEKVDWAIMETGMGGRLDATNVLSPSVCIISNISLEHRDYLGNTLSEIAFEKAGIIKPGVPVVTGVRQESAREVIERVARERSAPVFRLGRDFRTRKNADNGFTYFGLDHAWKNLRTSLLGSYQQENAAQTLAACEVLMRSGVAISPDAAAQGLSSYRWPGRLEVVSTDPTVILDGAHNIAAARNLARYLSENLSGRKITLVAGILDDKPFRAILKTLLAPCTKAVITRPKIGRAIPAESLGEAAREFVEEVSVSPTVADAIRHAMQTAEKDEVICVAGSLYVVGEAKEFFDGVTADPPA